MVILLIIGQKVNNNSISFKRYNRNMAGETSEANLMSLRLSIYLALFLIALVQTSEARVFTPVGEHNRLDARIVSSLMVDSQGLLWVGSREGLYRYDGYEAQVFLPETGNPNAINDIDIRVVYEDSSEIIWVGTTDMTRTPANSAVFCTTLRVRRRSVITVYSAFPRVPGTTFGLPPGRV